MEAQDDQPGFKTHRFKFTKIAPRWLRSLKTIRIFFTLIIFWGSYLHSQPSVEMRGYRYRGVAMAVQLGPPIDGIPIESLIGPKHPILISEAKRSGTFTSSLLNQHCAEVEVDYVHPDLLAIMKLDSSILKNLGISREELESKTGWLLEMYKEEGRRSCERAVSRQPLRLSRSEENSFTDTCEAPTQYELFTIILLVVVVAALIGGAYYVYELNGRLKAESKVADELASQLNNMQAAMKKQNELFKGLKGETELLDRAMLMDRVETFTNDKLKAQLAVLNQIMNGDVGALMAHRVGADNSDIVMALQDMNPNYVHLALDRASWHRFAEFVLSSSTLVVSECGVDVVRARVCVPNDVMENLFDIHETVDVGRFLGENTFARLNIPPYAASRNGQFIGFLDISRCELKGGGTYLCDDSALLTSCSPLSLDGCSFSTAVVGPDTLIEMPVGEKIFIATKMKEFYIANLHSDGTLPPLDDPHPVPSSGLMELSLSEQQVAVFRTSTGELRVIHSSKPVAFRLVAREGIPFPKIMNGYLEELANRNKEMSDISLELDILTSELKPVHPDIIRAELSGTGFSDWVSDTVDSVRDSLKATVMGMVEGIIEKIGFPWFVAIVAVVSILLVFALLHLLLSLLSCCRPSCGCCW